MLYEPVILRTERDSLVLVVSQSRKTDHYTRTIFWVRLGYDEPKMLRRATLPWRRHDYCLAALH